MEERGGAARGECTGEILAGGLRLRHRERGAGDAVVWLRDPLDDSTLLKIVAPHCRLIELSPPEADFATGAVAVREALATLGVERFSLVAEGRDSVLALSVALDHPGAVAALVLLAPTLIDANGQAAAGAEALVPKLSALDAPLLAVFGTSDRVTLPEAARHYRERLATSNLIFVYDAGHAMGEERPEAVADLVLDFLRRRDLFLVRQTSDLLYR